MRVSGIQFNVDTHCLSLYRLKSEHSVHSGHVWARKRPRDREREGMFFPSPRVLLFQKCLGRDCSTSSPGGLWASPNSHPLLICPHLRGAWWDTSPSPSPLLLVPSSCFVLEFTSAQVQMAELPGNSQRPLAFGTIRPAALQWAGGPCRLAASHVMSKFARSFLFFCLSLTLSVCLCFMPLIPLHHFFDYFHSFDSLSCVCEHIFTSDSVRYTGQSIGWFLDRLLVSAKNTPCYQCSNVPKG